MDPHIWPSKNRKTSSNTHTAAMWGYGMYPEDLLEAMNDREKWRERVRDICASGTKWSYLPNPSARAGYDTRSIFNRSLTGFNSEFSFSFKAEEPSLSYYLPIAGGRIIGFIPFPRVLVLCEMQSFSSKIWTRVAVSISCDDNNYTTGTTWWWWWWWWHVL